MIFSFVVVAAEEHVGGRLAGLLLHHVGDRPARLDRRLLRLQGRQLAGQPLVPGVVVAEPPGEQLVGLLRRPLVGRLGEQVGRPPGLRQLLHLAVGQPTGVEADLGEPDPVGPLALGPLAEPERHLRADRGLQVVGLDVGRLRLAVDEDAGAGRRPGAVVDHAHVVEPAGQQRRPGHHLQGVLPPLVDDVRGDPVGLEPSPQIAQVLHPVDGFVSNDLSEDGDRRPGVNPPQLGRVGGKVRAE